jgi:carboxyl-terminal processing protease
VNDESASASEILAGALQDYGRALLVGERTYGKFLVQTHFPLESRDALVRITTSRYETPKGRIAQRHNERGLRGGMLPDVNLPLDSDSARDALARQFGQESDERIWRVMEAERGTEPPIDAQLAAALDLLRGAPAPAEPLLRRRVP